MALTSHQIEEQLNLLHMELAKNTEVTANILARFDEMDLNGTASYLRDFGNWLEDNPDFFRRIKVAQSARQERTVAFEYLRKLFRIPVMGTKVKWLVSAVGTGLLFALGANLVPHLVGWMDRLLRMLGI